MYVNIINAANHLRYPIKLFVRPKMKYPNPVVVRERKVMSNDSHLLESLTDHVDLVHLGANVAQLLSSHHLASPSHCVELHNHRAYHPKITPASSIHSGYHGEEVLTPYGLHTSGQAVGDGDWVTEMIMILGAVCGDSGQGGVWC